VYIVLFSIAVYYDVTWISRTAWASDIPRYQVIWRLLSLVPCTVCMQLSLS